MIEIRTGSDSDILKMKEAYTYLEEHEIEYSPRILSAHRTPSAMVEAAKNLSDEGFRVSVCAAGGAAHLPGMTASETLVPVVGLPIIASTLQGLDSFLSIVQMPDGIPVGTVGAGQSKAAVELASRIAHLDNLQVRNNLRSKLGLRSLDQIDLVKRLSIHFTEDIEASTQKEILDFATELSIPFEVVSEDSIGPVTLVVQALHSSKNVAAYLSQKYETVQINLYLSCNSLSQSSITQLWSDKAESWTPVALMGLNRYKNAVLYGAQVLAQYDESIHNKLMRFRSDMKAVIEVKNEHLSQTGVKDFIKS